MKVRNQKDVKDLHDKIYEELGIDVYKYNDEQVADNFSELLIFPQYVVKCLMRPIVIALIIYILSFFVINLDGYENYIYGFFGLFLYITSALLIGLLLLLNKIKQDIMDLILYSLDVMESAITDLNHVNAQTNRSNRIDVLNLLFTGIIHIVTIPMVSQIISGKIPFIGGLFNKIIIKILTMVANKINFGSKQMNLEFDAESNQSNLIKKYIQIIEAAKSNVNKVLRVSLTVTKIPIMLLTFLSLLVLIAFVLFIHWL